MSLWNLIKSSFSSLKKNKMRSFLSILGIIIGVVTVITVLSTSEAFRTYIIKEYKNVGTKLMWLIPDDGNRSINKGLEEKDLNILSSLSFVKLSSPYTSMPHSIKMNGQQGNINVVGVNSSYDEIRMLKAEGQFISNIDYINKSRVCVISDDVRKIYLNRNINPIGSSLKIKGVNFTVIGYLPPKNSSAKLGLDESNCVYIPLSTFWNCFDTQSIDMIMFTVDDETMCSQYKATIQQKAMGTNKNIKIDSVYENMKNMDFIFTTVTIVTILITSIGLIVSGIGIMNVLLMSIAERKWEIGLRKAVGADNRNILMQFLTESVMLSFIGAASGLIVSLAMIISLSFFTKLPINISWFAAVVSISFCSIIGIFFGIFPAIKAAGLEPVECLEQ